MSTDHTDASTRSGHDVGTAMQASGPRSRLRTLIGIGSGNAIEWFDWNVYATFTTFLAASFFNKGDSVSAVLSTLAVFAVGFVARPFGGLLFGWIADVRGRKLSMTLTIGLASAGSIVIGLCPSYATIGWGASAVLLICRLVQGLAHGGELPSAQTYVAESAPNSKRGLWSSLIYFSGTCGVIVGTLFGAVLTTALSKSEMMSYGWRIPFVVGGLFGLYAMFMRRRMHETEAFSQENEAQTRTEGSSKSGDSIWRTITEHPRLFVQVILTTVGGTVIYYVWGISAPAYAISQRHIEASHALWAGVGANLIFLAALPMWGAISDRIGRKPVLIFGATVLAVTYAPLNAMIGSSALRLFVAMSIAMALIAALSSIVPAVYAEIFPTRIRATGFGIPYSIAVAVFGGTAPYLQTYLASKGMAVTFQIYVIVALLLGAVVYWTFPETKGIDLRHESVGAHGRRKERDAVR